MIATGVLASIPPTINRSAIDAARAAPIRITSVVPVRASASQFSEASWAGSSCAVITVIPADTPRIVTGIPAAAGAAIDDDTPGTSVTSIPALSSATASSPPRPNTKGSPPLSRTTQSNRRPRSIRISLISSCAFRGEPGVLPTSTNSAHGAASANTPGSTSRSWTITSARASKDAAFRVNRCGSPGPAPTR